MKIKELEQASGIPRASIRFYEKEGLLEPERTENGYRAYSDGDLETLKKIVLLRALQVPLKDIRALQLGQDTLDKVLERQLTALTGQQDALDKSMRVCRELRDAHVDYRDLPAQKYLDSFDRAPRAAVAKEDSIPRVQAPVRRFFARELDLTLYSALWIAFLSLVCGVGVRSHRGLLSILDAAVPLVMMLLVEPLLLHLCGTTPGKWVLGLRVTDPEGGLLSYGDGCTRTGRVIVRGLGLQIPVISLIRLWKSYRACDEDRELSWEEDSMLSLKDEKPWRPAAYALLLGAIFALLGLAIFAAGMPRHRGELSTAEFSDNFNRLARFYGYSFVVGGYDAELDANGLWTKDPSGDGIYTLDLLDQGSAPILAIREGPAGVEEVSFRYENSSNIPSSCQREMQLTVLSFACAQEDFGLFSRGRKELLRAISDHPFESFAYSRGGIDVRCEVEYAGYRPVGSSLFPDFTDEAEERRFTLAFSIRYVG